MLLKMVRFLAFVPICSLAVTDRTSSTEHFNVGLWKECRIQLPRSYQNRIEEKMIEDTLKERKL